MWDNQTTDDQRDFCFDPRVIEWDSFVNEIHLPSVVKAARVRTTPGGKTGLTRTDRLRGQILAPERQLAAFDLENTLIASNVVASYAYLATRRMPKDQRLRFIAKMIAEGPTLLSLDRKDRTDFLRFFYRRYDGAPLQQIDEDSAEMFSRLILSKSFPEAIRRVREHKAAGHRTVLITGALDFVVKPLAPLFDDIIAAEMNVTNGRYDGELRNVPPTGETRAQVLRDYAESHGLSLSETVAYADSSSDLPMLEAVGFPVAVNPKPASPPLPANAVGWSRTSRRLLVRHVALSPSVHVVARMAASPIRSFQEARHESPALRAKHSPLCRSQHRWPSEFRRRRQGWTASTPKCRHSKTARPRLGRDPSAPHRYLRL